MIQQGKENQANTSMDSNFRAKTKKILISEKHSRDETANIKNFTSSNNFFNKNIFVTLKNIPGISVE